MPDRVPLSELALVFLKLGTLAFGGPAAHIALMEEEFVTRRQWLTRQEFLDRLGAANLIPGPSSTEMAIHIGLVKCGWRGLLVAGCCFILPAAVLVCLIAAAYVKYGALPAAGGILHGVKPVVVAVIVQAFWKLARSAVKNRFLVVVGVVAAVLCFFEVNNLLVLLLAGALAVGPVMVRKVGEASGHPAVMWPGAIGLKTMPAALLGAAGAVVAAPFSLWRLFLTFAKIGSVLFGSGYILLAFLRSDFVVHLRWLTEGQLLDSIAMGQVTPGPVFTTATFIGYLLGGIPGAVVATAGIFIPGFILVAASGPLVPRIRRSAVAAAILDGVVVGSLALMSVVTWQLARTALVDVPTAAIAVASAALLLRTRLNPAWLIVAAGVAGLVQGMK